MKRILALLSCLALGDLAVAAQVGFDADGARKVFEAKCVTCHPLDRPLKKNKDRPGWQKTVERMRGYAAGAITEQDASTIVEYLTRTHGLRP